MLMTFLEEEGHDNLESAILNFEALEKQYWINTLGKRAAVEILSVGRISVETMDKLLRLPEELYIKATQVCVTLANAVDESTRQAEEDVGISPPVNENIHPSKGIRLKKIKQ